jgi:tetratricopeptide (TPR) repeat protein
MSFMSWRYSALTIALCGGLALVPTAKAQDGAASDRARDQSKDQSPDQSKGQGQDSGTKRFSARNQLPQSDAPPRSDAAGDPAETLPALPSATGDDRTFSSSREDVLDLSPPKDDLKDHPGSAAAMAREAEEENAANGDVQEFHQWNPMRALKNVEVGDYYFKRKNYRAAMDRYKEALFYKENDAVATFRLAVSQEKLGDKTGALNNYTAYLKILPHGPFADEAQNSIGRLSSEAPSQK